MSEEQIEAIATEIQSMKRVLPTVAEPERDAFVEQLAELENQLAQFAQEIEFSLMGEEK